MEEKKKIKIFTLSKKKNLPYEQPFQGNYLEKEIKFDLKQPLVLS